MALWSTIAYLGKSHDTRFRWENSTYETPLNVRDISHCGVFIFYQGGRLEKESGAIKMILSSH